MLPGIRVGTPFSGRFTVGSGGENLGVGSAIYHFTGAPFGVELTVLGDLFSLEFKSCEEVQFQVRPALPQWEPHFWHSLTMYSLVSPIGATFPPKVVGVPSFSLNFQNDNRIAPPETLNGHIPVSPPVLVPSFPLTSFLFSISFESGPMSLSAKNFSTLTLLEKSSKIRRARPARA